MCTCCKYCKISDFTETHKCLNLWPLFCPQFWPVSLPSVHSVKLHMLTHWNHNTHISRSCALHYHHLCEIKNGPWSITLNLVHIEILNSDLSAQHRVHTNNFSVNVHTFFTCKEPKDNRKFRHSVSAVLLHGFFYLTESQIIEGPCVDGWKLYSSIVEKFQY